MTNLLDTIGVQITVIFMSMMPLIELRGAIPFGISLGLSPINAAMIAFAGSMIPVPFILFATRPIFNYLRKKKSFEKLIEKLTHRSMNHAGKGIIKYGILGLIIFVAIPIPGTGVWSGSLAASVIDIRVKLAFPAIMIGNALAAVQIMTLSHGVINILT